MVFLSFVHIISAPCKPNPCQNSGTCFAKPDGGHHCVCPPGYSGDDCEKGEYTIITYNFQPAGSELECLP